MDVIHTADAALVADLERRLGGRVLQHDVKDIAAGQGVIAAGQGVDAAALHPELPSNPWHRPANGPTLSSSSCAGWPASSAIARDLEVQEERIATAVGALPPELAMGPIAAETTRFFARRRADASNTADEAMDSDRYLALLDAIDALLAQGVRS